MTTRARKTARPAKAKRATLGPTHTGNPDTWLAAALGGNKSQSGVMVSRDTALSYPPAWRAINILAGDVGKLPLNVFKRVEDDGRELDKDHPAFHLLRREPNTEMGAFTWKQMAMGHRLIHGNHYSHVKRRGDGVPMEVVPLRPDVTYPIRINGVLRYVTEIDGVQYMLLPDNVLHFKGFGFDGLIGYNVLEYAKNALGLGLAAQEYGSKFFSNGARPSVIIEHPASLSEMAAKKLRESWDKMHAGLDNVHRTAVLEEGMKVNPLSFNARDSQLNELRQFQVRDIANIFGVPAHRLGDDLKTSHNSLEEENASYLQDLDSHLVPIEEECWAKLLTEDEKSGDTHYIEFNRDALLRADTKTKAESHRIALAGVPWVTVNEVRKQYNLPDLPDADELIIPGNLNPNVDGDEMTPEKEKPTDKPDDEEKKSRLRSLFVHEVRRSAVKLAAAATRALKSKKPLADWLATVPDDDGQRAMDEIQPVYECLDDAGGELWPTIHRSFVGGLVATLTTNPTVDGIAEWQNNTLKAVMVKL